MRAIVTSRPIARAVLRAALLAPLAPPSLAAQHAHELTGLGSVHFETSCRREVAPQFDRAIALLHSFEFGAALRGFEQVLASDSTCAMAHWGIALARWSNPMAVNVRPPALLARARVASNAAKRLAAAATARERGYAEAVAKLYDGHETLDQPARLAAYEAAMADLVARQPGDSEAKIFHALAMVAAAPPTDKSYARQRKAGALLEALWKEQPNHPGLAHYIIHSYDYPPLAPQAAAAARRYAEIAPAATHALHMPSHTFTRLGHWEASVASNRRSAESALRDSSLAELLHAYDYQVYAYLQMRRDSAAKAVLARLPSIAARFDPTKVTGAAPGWAGVFALAAIPARYALERRAWAEAAVLTPHASAWPYAEAMTWFARALGAARTGRTTEAHASVDTLGAIAQRLTAAGEPYWAEQVAIQRLGAQAWLALAEGRKEDALARLREAAEREDATEKSAVTPGPLAPAREQLADLLLELGRPAEALAEYRRTMAKEPNRFLGLEGARRAALAAGDRKAATFYASEIAKLTGG
jgi:hypothetical protein